MSRESEACPPHVTDPHGICPFLTHSSVGLPLCRDFRRLVRLTRTPGMQQTIVWISSCLSYVSFTHAFFCAIDLLLTQSRIFPQHCCTDPSYSRAAHICMSLPPLPWRLPCFFWRPFHSLSYDNFSYATRASRLANLNFYSALVTAQAALKLSTCDMVSATAITYTHSSAIETTRTVSEKHGHLWSDISHCYPLLCPLTEGHRYYNHRKTCSIPSWTRIYTYSYYLCLTYV